MFQCVRCHSDVQLPILCLKCHGALWCSTVCKANDNVHIKFCEDRCQMFSTALTIEGKRLPIEVVKFACRICYNDYEKAWKILNNQGVRKTDHFMCDVLSGPEIVQFHTK